MKVAGFVEDFASEKLGRIRRKIRETEDQVRQVMQDILKNYRGKYSQFWIERWGLIPELPTSFDNANSMYELVAWLQRAFKNLLDDFQQLEAEFEDFKNAIIDLLEYLIPELIRRYHDSAEFRTIFISLLEDILVG